MDDNLQLTTEGERLCKMWSEDVPIAISTPNLEAFDRWWNTYPGTDTFTHKNKSFKGNRAIRVRKDECKSKFNKILAEGNYDVDKMIQALQIEVEQKKDASVKTGLNKMTYMQNSLTYLNQRTFEPYIELIGKKVEVKARETAI